MSKFIKSFKTRKTTFLIMKQNKSNAYKSLKFRNKLQNRMVSFSIKLYDACVFNTDSIFVGGGREQKNSFKPFQDLNFKEYSLKPS